jgi:hypothetical protein
MTSRRLTKLDPPVAADRNLHFRSIVDYAATQDILMRYFGIHALRWQRLPAARTAR